MLSNGLPVFLLILCAAAQLQPLKHSIFAEDHKILCHEHEMLLELKYFRILFYERAVLLELHFFFRILHHERETLLKLIFFQLVEQRCSWGSILLSIYQKATHNLKMKMCMRETVQTVSHV